MEDMLLKRKKFSSHPEPSTKVLIQQLPLFGNSCYCPGRFCPCWEGILKQTVSANSNGRCKELFSLLYLVCSEDYFFLWLVCCFFILFSVGYLSVIQLGRPFISFLDIVEVPI